MSKRKRDRKSPAGPGHPLAVTAPARQAGSRRGGRRTRSFTVGGRVGLVVVRRGRFDKDDVDRLQKGLSPLSRTRPGHGGCADQGAGGARLYL